MVEWWKADGLGGSRHDLGGYRLREVPATVELYEIWKERLAGTR